MADYRLLAAILLSIFIVQFVKVAIFMIKYKKRFHVNDIFVTGGMPSSHSALVCSLATGIYFMSGLSVVFVISLVLALIVLRDAYGVRRTVGNEGMIINKIIEKTRLKIPEMHYSQGHKPSEVLVGSAIGIVISYVIFALL